MTTWKYVPMKTAMKKPYVRVVDDEEDVRTSMALLLRLAGIDVRTYESAADLMENGEFETPGCLVLDIRMPGMDGLRLQEMLIASHVDLPILFLTGHGDVDTAVTVMRRGAVDFIQKPPAPEVFLASIRKYVAWHERVRAHVMRVSDARAQYEKLTLREKEVLRGVAEGLLNKQIAFKCSIGIETVKTYRANALAKLDIRTAVEARDFLIFIGEIQLDTLPLLSNEVQEFLARGCEARKIGEEERLDCADETSMRIDRNAVRESLLND